MPEWIEVLPAGEFYGYDGRKFINNQPDAVIASRNQQGRDLVIDWEHTTEKKAPIGEEAPAAGWVKDYQNREGKINTQVEWTPRAAEQIKNKEYRYISPVFMHDKAGLIHKLVSIGLTNKPNLELKSLNQEQTQLEEQMESIPALICAALGIKPDATEATVVTAITALKTDLQTAKNQEQQPDLTQFVPRSDYDLAMQKATNAEQELTQIKSESHEADVDAVIKQGIADGKIAPVNKDFYKATCHDAEGLEQLKTMIGKAPLIAPESGLDGKKPPDSEKALNTEQQQVADAFGNTAEDLKKYR